MITERFICSCRAKWRRRAGWFTCSLALTVLAEGAPLQAPSPALPSITSGGASYVPVCSADGSRVAFLSQANNLVQNFQPSVRLNVYLRDVPSFGTYLISVSSTELGGGDSDSHSPALSADARLIAFVSEAGNLVTGDTNKASDIFLRDLNTNQTTLITRPFDGLGSAIGDFGYSHVALCDAPRISEDGRWIAYESRATNLTELADLNQAVDIFVRDRQNEITLLISRNAAGLASGNGPSDQPSLALAGARIAFVSRATDLSSEPNSQQGDVYVRDLVSGELFWASRHAWLDLGARSFDPQLSDEGRHLVFFAVGLASPATTYLLYHHLTTGVSLLVASNAVDTTTAHISADGRYVSYAAAEQVFLWDSLSGLSEQVSIDLPGIPASYAATKPVMNADASIIAFQAETTNGVSQFYVRDRAQGVTALATAGQDQLPNRAELDSFFPALSRDGHWLAFESTDALLVTPDGNHEPDIFVRDLQANGTSLVSARHPSLAARTGSGRSVIWRNSIAADGSRVAFSSLDSDLAPNDRNEWADAFVYDLSTQTNFPASGSILPASQGAAFHFQTNGFVHSTVLSGTGGVLAYVTATLLAEQFFTELMPGQIHCLNLTTGERMIPSDPQRGRASFPALSPDGRWVAFTTDSSPGRNIYLAELNQAQPIGRIISRGPQPSSQDNSIRGQFSPDGQLLLFLSNARQLTPEPKAGQQVYAYDMVSSNLTLVSRGLPGQGLAESVDHLVFSGDSRFVAFQTPQSRQIYRRDLSVPDQTSQLICTNCLEPSLNQDGRWIAYAAGSESGAHTDVYLHDVENDQRMLLSSNVFGMGGGNGESFSPLVTPHGRFVVFASDASDLVNNDANGRTDIFLRDVHAHSTLLLSINATGTSSGNNLSSHPILSQDGRTVVFGSFASDLVPGDYNQTRDVFVVRLAAPDEDGDQMDDDWEMAYFNSLSRDGTEDFDQDGQSDLGEFQAGTDPTNQQSVLRVITLQRIAGGSITVLWAAVPGRRYQVQFKEYVGDLEWATLPEIVTPSSPTGTYVDSSEPAVHHRFYRVALVQ